jgi:hypothetical protein
MSDGSGRRNAGNSRAEKPAAVETAIQATKRATNSVILATSLQC